MISAARRRPRGHRAEDRSLAVSAAAAGSKQIEVTLADSHGSMWLESSSGLTVTDAGTGSIELFGSQAAINAALADGVIYDPTANYTGSDTLTITANDQGHNGTSIALSTSQEVGITSSPAIAIADGANLTVSVPRATPSPSPPEPERWLLPSLRPSPAKSPGSWEPAMSSISKASPRGPRPDRERRLRQHYQDHDVDGDRYVDNRDRSRSPENCRAPAGPCRTTAQ